MASLAPEVAGTYLVHEDPDSLPASEKQTPSKLLDDFAAAEASAEQIMLLHAAPKVPTKGCAASLAAAVRLAVRVCTELRRLKPSAVVP